MTADFRQRLDNGANLEDIRHEAFAVSREAAARLRYASIRRADSRWLCFAPGRIAEMKTGEGKTLVATMPCYLTP